MTIKELGRFYAENTGALQPDFLNHCIGDYAGEIIEMAHQAENCGTDEHIRTIAAAKLGNYIIGKMLEAGKEFKEREESEQETGNWLEDDILRDKKRISDNLSMAI